MLRLSRLGGLGLTWDNLLWGSCTRFAAPTWRDWGALYWKMQLFRFSDGWCQDAAAAEQRKEAEEAGIRKPKRYATIWVQTFLKYASGLGAQADRKLREDKLRAEIEQKVKEREEIGCYIATSNMVIFQTSSASFGSGRRRGNRKKHKRKRQLHSWGHFNPCIFAQIMVEAARKRAIFFQEERRTQELMKKLEEDTSYSSSLPSQMLLNNLAGEKKASDSEGGGFWTRSLWVYCAYLGLEFWSLAQEKRKQELAKKEVLRWSWSELHSLTPGIIQSCAMLPLRRPKKQKPKRRKRSFLQHPASPRDCLILPNSR